MTALSQRAGNASGAGELTLPVTLTLTIYPNALPFPLLPLQIP